MKPAASEGASVEERHDPLTGMPRFEEPNWTIVPVQRSTMRALQQRSNVPGLIRLGTYLGLLVILAR